MKVTPGSVEGTHVVLTGPIAGSVTLEDGTTYDVSPQVIEVDPDHADEVAHLIGQRYADEGHPNVPDGFVYDGPSKSPKKKRS